MSSFPPAGLPSRRQVATGSVVAIAVAAVALVFFVLPAETGIDPTGFGKKTGLTGMAKSANPNFNIYLERGQKRTNVLYPQAATAQPNEPTLRAALAGKGVAMPTGEALKTDTWTYELLPYESIEMKYRMAQGQPMIFAWKATAAVHFDEHSVPDQGGNPATESFVIADAPSQTAVYVAPFTGIHGWFWQNQSLQPVTLSIEATGGFSDAVIFNEAGEHPRELSPR